MSANLDALRGEYEHLSLRMNRVAILTLTVVLLLVLGLTNAIREVRKSPEYQRLIALRKAKPEVDRSAMWPLPKPTVEVDGSVIWPRQASSDETDDAVKAREQLLAAAATAYTREVSVLGAKVSVDLREALIVLPAILLACALYLLVLWFKREAVQRIGEHALAGEEQPDVDCLYFGAIDTAYAEHPGRLGWWSFLLAMATLLYILAKAASPIWRSWEVQIEMMYLSLAVFVGVCAFLYALAAGANIDDQASARIGRPPRGGLRSRAIASAAAVRAWLAKAWRARILGLSGSTLVVLSLFLPMGIACEGPFEGVRIVAGWELVRNPLEPAWLTSHVVLFVRSYLGVTMYAVSLVVAIVSAAAFAIWFRRPVPRRLAAVMFRVAALASAYVAADTGFFHPLLVLMADPLDALFGGLPDIAETIVMDSPVCVFFLTAVVATIVPRHRRITPLLRRAVIPFVPIVSGALAGATAAALDGIPGYASYTLGSFGLAIAWYAVFSPHLTRLPALRDADLVDSHTGSAGIPTHSSSPAPAEKAP